jgi:type II secretory ATPase GspE/PulE/Tfp pilus assembly ATPase PilB-like protein
MYGESVVLRLLDRGDHLVRLEDLGMPDGILAAMRSLARKAYGLVLVTGPTGSGKTTTLYIVLQMRETAVEKLITVEDPIEYQLPGVTQVPVHREAGVSFAQALRSILRQDPDVLMIGEMRDQETAGLAVQAAMTGHLVFSTLHTNDALGAIPRLTDLGVPPYLVAATLEAVLAQRLVRRVCESCAERYTPSREELSRLELSAEEMSGVGQLVRGRGCAVCRGTGYRGRVGVFELVVVSEELREAIARGASQGELRALIDASASRARSHDRSHNRSHDTTLRSDGWAKAVAGITTIEEVLRVVQS